MLCYDVARALHARGHSIQVLTSDYHVDGAQEEVAGFDVLRLLKLESDINYYSPLRVASYWPERWKNAAYVKHAITTFRPDVVFIWGMWNLSRVVPWTAEQIAGSRVAYYFADAWPTRPSAHRAYWTAANGSRRGKLFKRLAQPMAQAVLWPEWRGYRLRFEHAMCCSYATRQEIVAAGIPVERAQIVYEGIELAPFLEVADSRQDDRMAGSTHLALAYVGRLVAHKGVHTIIHALKWLAEEDRVTTFKLTILGQGHPDYEAHLRALVQDAHLEETVTFQAPIPRSQLPSFLAQHDILVLPSVYEEPLARIMQDALAAGMVVVATWTGGTKETIVDGENGLVFAPEDHIGLAKQLLRVAHDPSLRWRLRVNAADTAKKMFDLKRMTDEIEMYLERVAQIRLV